jgi:hypothetical protein
MRTRDEKLVHKGTQFIKQNHYGVDNNNCCLDMADKMFQFLFVHSRGVTGKVKSLWPSLKNKTKQIYIDYLLYMNHVYFVNNQFYSILVQ